MTRRHPDIGHHDVRRLTVDRLEQGVQVPADRGDLEAWLSVDQPSNTFANEVMILCEHDADGHGRRIRP